jgi:F0F1-type ATP synthase membrane subunit b/b'
MRKFILLTFIILLATPIKSGWVSDLLGGFFGDIVDDATKGLIDNAKEAFRESMDYLFDNKIKDMINQIEATADRVIDKAKDDINAIIDNAKQEMQDLIDHAVEKAEEFVDHTVDEIKDKIIDEAFDRLDKFEEKLFQDLTNVLNEVDAIIKEMSCMVQAVIDRIENDIIKLLPWLPNPFEACRENLDRLFPGQGMRWKLVSLFSPSQLYEYRKCRLLNDLTEDSPIQAIQMAYRDWEFLAGDMRCLSVAMSADLNEKYYLKEMGDAAYLYYIIDGTGKNISGAATLKYLK